VDFNVCMAIYFAGTLLTMGVILGYSFAQDHNDGSIYLTWFALAWPALWVVLIPALIVYRVSRWERL
jgi:hypothetical protein